MENEKTKKIHLSNAAFGWFDNSFINYDSLEDEEFVKLFCSTTGLTSEEYASLMLPSSEYFVTGDEMVDANLLYNTILGWYDNSMTKHKGLNDSIFVRTVCSQVGLSLEEYSDLMGVTLPEVQTRRVCVTRYGYVDIPSFSDKDAETQAEQLNEHSFDWTDFGEANVIDIIG